MLPGEGGPVVAKNGNGDPFEVFDVTEQLGARYGRIYVVDLDGVEHDRPQLDYLQEISRDGEMWVEAGVRSADQAIDILVTGAHRAVLGTAFLPSERALARAWKLSTDLAFEIEIRDGKVPAVAEEWQGRSPRDVAAAVRAVGPSEVVLSFRETPVDWSVVQAVGSGGPAWVDGTFGAGDGPRLGPAGAAGGIFHIHDFLATFVAPASTKDGREPAG
jgi:hypothetical protein